MSSGETDYDVEEAVRRYRSTDDPVVGQMVEVGDEPPARAEAVEDAEEREFAG